LILKNDSLSCGESNPDAKSGMSPREKIINCQRLHQVLNMSG
jgi:hypothetical protein